MRIGIDARALEVGLAGIGRYVYELAKCLDVLMPDACFFFYSRRPILVPRFSDRWIYRTEPLSVARSLRNIPWQKFRSGAFVKQDQLDFYWASATFLPWHDIAAKTIVTVHDLNHLVVPDTMPFLTRQAYRLYFEKDVARANYVMVNSTGTAERLRKYYSIRADLVVRPGVSAAFTIPSAQESQRTLDELKIRSPYILALGTLEPRKNLVGLVHAFLELKSRGHLNQHELLIVGGSGWGSRDLMSKVGGASEDVRLMGYVEDRHLPALYRAAKIFAFPSLYEGFGIPALEATVCGANVVTTDIPELREATLGSAIYVRADVASISDGLMQAMRRAPPRTVERVGTTWMDQAGKFANFLSSQKPVNR